MTVDALLVEEGDGSDGPIESGQPLVALGVARLGQLSVACDGSIEGQVCNARCHSASLPPARSLTSTPDPRRS